MEQVNQSFMSKTKEFLRECRRVLKVTKKPSTEEFKTIVKVCAVGMGIIGAIGFLLQMIWRAIQYGI
ncbi:MAG: protein translocase SEC61 complex subunit gamma [Candidatus Nanoarchaeia archaeon]